MSAINTERLQPNLSLINSLHHSSIEICLIQSTPGDSSHDRPSTVLHTSRKLHEAANVLEGLCEESGTDFSDDELAEMKKEDDFKPVRGKPGMFYKVSSRTLKVNSCLLCVTVVYDSEKRCIFHSYGFDYM